MTWRRMCTICLQWKDYELQVMSEEHRLIMSRPAALSRLAAAAMAMGPGPSDTLGTRLHHHFQIDEPSRMFSGRLQGSHLTHRQDESQSHLQATC